MRVWVGFDARPQVLPQRQLELLCSLPPGTEPPRRLGSPPWSLSPEVIQTARPDRRAWATAWLLAAICRLAEETCSVASLT